MIIERVHAINVLKYAEVTLEDLPADGLIAISGPNEAGKSTIGETVCFALFGRTFSLGADETEKIVRWGEDQCSVNIIVEVDGGHYEISRFLDRDGNHSARLNRVGEETPIAKGVVGVSEALINLLGYDFDEFIESFYLAQREITTPHPHSHAVKIMAGVASMEHVVDEFDQVIDDQHEKLAELETELESADIELAELAVDDDYLPVMEKERVELGKSFAENRRLQEEIESGIANYMAKVPELRAAQSAKSSASVFRYIFLLLALAAGGLWALLAKGSHLPQAKQALGMLHDKVPNWSDGYINYIGIAAIVLAVLFLIYWMRVASKKSLAQGLTGEAVYVAEPLAKVRDVVDQPPPDVIVDELEVVDVDAETDGSDASEPAPVTQSIERPSQDEFARIHPRIANAEADVREASDYTDRERDWLQEQMVRQSLRINDLDRDLEEESARVHQASTLHDVLSGLKAKQSDMQQTIKIREYAIELLEGSSRQMSSQFNRDIRDLVGRTLPLFTDGRYEHLQIGEDLGVRVFSSEKRDFMDLDEVSSGTQRQIMLALRLALSQKLLNRAVKGRQFAFLDEPFAFFDEIRTRKALDALRNLSDDISQILIVAQSFPVAEGEQFATVVDCQRDFVALTVTG